MNKCIIHLWIIVLALSLEGCRDASVIKTKYANGELEGIIQIDDQGRNDGLSVLYYENGVIEKLVDFHHGIADGWYREYYPSGKLSVMAAYRNGKQDGKYYKFYRNGRLASVQSVRNNSTHGQVLIFDSLRGKLTSISEYFNGELYFFNNYDAKGTVVKSYQRFALLPLMDTLQKGRTYQFIAGQTGYHYPALTYVDGEVTTGKGTMKIEKIRDAFYSYLRPELTGTLAVTIIYGGELQGKAGIFRQETKFYVKD